MAVSALKPTGIPSILSKPGVSFKKKKYMPRGIYHHNPPSEETKRKISLANKGKKKSETQRNKMREVMMGKKHCLGKQAF